MNKTYNVNEATVLAAAKKKSSRPAQQLYVPPAQRRNKVPTHNVTIEKSPIINRKEEPKMKTKVVDDLSKLTLRNEDVPQCTCPITNSANCDTLKENILSSSPNSEVDIKLNRKIIEGNLHDANEPRENQNVLTSSDRVQSSSNNRKVDCELDKEREEMRRATEKINRKSRPIIKYIDNNDALDIRIKEKNDVDNENRADWEDLLSETVESNKSQLGKLKENIKYEPNSLKSEVQNKALQDLDHVIEIHNFSASFKTHDIIQIYSNIPTDSMYIKWVDDTHAMLVFTTPALAQRALNVDNDLIKSRPMSEASKITQSVALKHDLRPAMKRPQTVLQTARRMINTHLGTKSSLSKEVLDQERKLLQDAREQRRLERQNEKDAWDGKPKSSTS